ncbi:MAG: rod-binding protein [Phycisphaerales bacterium]
MNSINTSWNPTTLSLLSKRSESSEIRADFELRQEDDIETKLEEARTAAEGLIATSFIKPILTQVRESNNAPAPFGPTQAEKQFGSLLDNQLADEITRAAQFPLVDRLVQEFTRHLPKDNTQASGVDLNA